ncbi:MAG TPA: LysR substrate-binding domain-containing protein [Janthinobacterium sp.]|nr:LysR substrate-binding domain-containing protein [Janthinobacterium sp.]
MDYFSAVRAFLHAAELQSFSRSAQEMAVKTSTVSRYVSELEKDLGIALFNRSTRGLVLTEGGRVFRERAAAALQVLEEARQAASSLNSRPQGLLRVTMPSAFGRRHIVPQLPAFMRLYPEIAVDAVLSDDTLNIIDAGIDVAVRIGALPDSLLMGKAVAPQRRIACASPAYLASRGGAAPAAPQDLAGHEGLRLALAADDKWLFTRLDAGADGAPSELVTLRGRLRADDSEALLALALAGCGVALLPTWLIADALADGRLLHLLPAWQAHAGRQPASVWLVYAPKKTVSSKVRAFIDFFGEKLAALP